MDGLYIGALAIEQLLLAECAVIAVLLAGLRLRRWLRLRGARTAGDVRPGRREPAPPAVPPGAVPPLFTRAPADPPSSAVTGQAAATSAARSVAPVPPVPVAARLAEVRQPPAAVPAPAASAVLVVRPRRESDDTVLSPETLLARAHEQLAAGAAEDAAAQLRLCVRLASKLKQPAVEAAARLELGDLARASGDLTTACEHWQMARALFTDLKRSAEMTATEQRMERAGCPTDWVLTQF